MKFSSIAKLAAVVALTGALAGCMDVSTELDIQSETTGKATTSVTIGKEFYPMIKQMAASAKAAGSTDTAATSSDPTSDFCKEEGDVLVENADGSGTCTSVKEGEFAKLTEGGNGPNEDASFTVVSPGVVKVSFKTDEMTTQVTEGQDAQQMEMMKAYFTGHNATIRIKGKKVTDTNMTLSSDGTAAEIVIPFSSLFDGSAKLPPELYAIGDTN
jgi:hypothetical protein